jgi:hypothetical protein
MTAALIFLGVSLFALIWGINSAIDVNDNMMQYDCRIAEISPDFTPAMKQECRNKQKEAK